MATISRSFDSHFHVINDEFPLVASEGYLPPTFNASSYEQLLQRDYPDLRVSGGAIVSGSFQMYDQAYLEDALKTLNKSESGGGFVGVTQFDPQIPPSVEELHRLDKLGVRAIRMNVNRGVYPDIAMIKDISDYYHSDELGLKWHTEFYIDAKMLLEQTALMDLFVSLPRISVDHTGLSAEGLEGVLQLLKARDASSDKAFSPSRDRDKDKDQSKTDIETIVPISTTAIKLTGFGRYQGSPSQLKTALITLLSQHPQQLMWATDLPCTRADRLFSPQDVRLLLDCIQEVAGCEGQQQEKEQALVDKVFWGNAERFYNPFKHQHKHEHNQHNHASSSNGASSASSGSADITMDSTNHSNSSSSSTTDSMAAELGGKDKSSPGKSNSNKSGQRIAKVMAASGVGSRRYCERIIADGRVTLNGALAILGGEGERNVTRRDEITLDGRVVIMPDNGTTGTFVRHTHPHTHHQTHIHTYLLTCTFIRTTHTPLAK